MHCPRFAIRLLIPALALLILLATPAFSQDPPDVAMGMSPTATYHGGDFDFVDMVSGRLNLNIPLIVDHSQRGKLNFTYAVTYSSTGEWYGVPQPIHYTTAIVKPPKYGVSAPAIGPRGALNSGLTMDVYIDDTGTKYYAYSAFENGVGVGTKHPMGLLTGNTAGSSTWESVDGSGIYAARPNNLTTTVTNKDGLQYFYQSPSSSVTDTNGNEMPLGGSFPTTDTLGRAWTATSSSNINGCPTGGPVAPSSSTIWAVPGPSNVNGGSRTFKFCYSVYSIQTNFTDSFYAVNGQYFANLQLLTGIVLPDGTAWRLDYDNNSYGDLTDIYTPTGGHFSYTWTTVAGCDSLSWVRIVTSRTVSDGVNSNTWTYSGPGGTETDPAGNDTVFSGYECTTPGAITQIQYYSGSTIHGGSRTLLKTETKSYIDLPDPFLSDFNSNASDPQLLSDITTNWANGQQSQVQYTYDSGFTFSDNNGGAGYTSKYGLVTAETHSDYYTGNPTNIPWLSKTNTTYQALSGPNASGYLAANILDLPSSVVITDGSGNKCAETDYGYDEFTADPSGVTQQHVAAPNSVRGNLTSITRQAFANPCTATNPSMTPFKTVNHVYDTGMIHTSTDPNQNTTTHAYSPTFYGAYVTQTTFPPTTSPNPANHIISGNYDFNSGLLTSFTDQNSNTTNYTYDIMLRPTNVTYPSPDGGQTNFYYPNATTVEMKKQIDATRWTDSFVYYDGLGRESRRMSVNDEASPYDQVDTCYDADGRVGFKSYPYQGNGTSTSKVCSGAGDAFTYDPLNRVTQVTHSDGSTALTSYAGRATSVSDEENGNSRVQRISQVDGLGRLASVCEVSSATQLGSGGTPLSSCGQDIGGPGFLTTYGYDALSNLTSVSQGGYLPRSFAYDSLSRLTTATNPESGSINYSYLASNGLLCSGDLSLVCRRTAPKPTQTSPSVTVTTTMTYDQLNRIRTKTYANSDNSTTYLAPSVTFNYDETSAVGVSGLLNTDGRSSSSVVAGSQAGEVFSYDKLGRVKINSQCTPLNCSAPAVFPINYTYDLLGDTLTATNGFGVTLTYGAYNRALRITGMTSNLSDSNHPGTLYSSPHYNAAGSVTSTYIGNPGSGVSETRGYDGRLRINSIADGSLYTVTIPTSGGYAPDSDILLANDSVNGNWTYGYDAFNRLASANATGQAYTFAYDRFGNRWQQNGPHSSQPGFDANNHIVGLGVTYDAAGNVTNDGTTAYTYDSENRIITATNSTSGAFGYLYDADGRRIRKTMPGNILLDYLYDLSGREMTQATATGSWYRGEVYAGERHIATYFNSTTYFNFADWLGTERARSSPGATTACETITSLPFGDAETTSGSCSDPSPMHFTGKERDAESGLDDFDARYYSSQYGRFMTPDWAANATAVPYADFGNPQSLNLYGYVKNNPLSYADPDGHDYLCIPCLLAAASRYVHPAESAQVAVGMGKQMVNNFVGNDVLSPSNGMQQAGADFLRNDVGPAVAIAAPFVGGESEAGAGALPNEAIVVRGGENTPSNFVNGKGVTVDGNGNLQGVSVNSAAGKTVEQLSQGIPNGKVGVTTVGDVRNAGGEVTPSPTANNPNHCTMCGVTPENASNLMKVQPNPARVRPPPPPRPWKGDE